MTERDAQIVELFKKGMSRSKIRELLNLSLPTVRTVLKKYGLSFEERMQRSIIERHRKLKELHKQNPLMSLEEFADALGCSKNSVLLDFKRLGIKRDSSSVKSAIAKKRWLKNRTELTRDLLLRLYISERKTQNEIAEITGYSAGSVVLYLRLNKISKHKKKF